MPVTATASAGELRSRVTIKRPAVSSPSPSPTGGPVETTPVVFADRIPAAIVSALGNEAIRASGLVSGITHIVKIRYLAGIQAYMTVTFETRQFQILSIVDVDERHVEHQLLCAEVQ